MLDWLYRLFRGPSWKYLEEEIAFLRAENHALRNSLLGSIGAPPVGIIERSNKPITRFVGRPSFQQQQAKFEAQAGRQLAAQERAPSGPARGE